LASLVAAATVLPAYASGGPISLQASFTESSTYVACPDGTPVGVVCARGTGSASKSPLGGLTESFGSAIDTAHPNPSNGSLPVYSVATLTTATGDQLFLITVGAFNPSTGVDPETFQVVGGTGRFRGASGSGTVLTTLTGQSGASLSSTSQYSGTIVLP
jgi:hypothetical protein